MTDRCLVCGAAAVRWCDHVVGIYNRGERTLRPLAEIEAGDVAVCSAPMCAAHGKQLGHISGPEPETLDVCPAHHDISSGAADWTRSREQLEAMRQQAWAECRRLGFRVVP